MPNNMPNKVITFAIPCYNTVEYMDHCIENLVALDSEDHDIEVIIVNDGSQDETFAKACKWVDKFPRTVRALNQQNGGHGAAVNKGLLKANGLYFKVVDSDDWLDRAATMPIMRYLRKQASVYFSSVRDAQFRMAEAIHPKEEAANIEIYTPTDMVIGNYVYEKVSENKQTPIDYANCLPQQREFGWEEVGRFKPSQYILMHSVIYRTELLREIGFELPHHTFYVDNIFVYVPMPYVRTMYYINTNMYRYFIGRDDQSVNQDVMMSRIDQQIKITKIMIDSVSFEMMSKSSRLRDYMVSYLSMMMCICSVFLRMIGGEKAEQQRLEIWEYLRDADIELFNAVRNSFICRSTNIPGKFGEKIAIWGYKIAQKLYNFN